MRFYIFLPMNGIKIFDILIIDVKTLKEINIAFLPYESQVCYIKPVTEFDQIHYYEDTGYGKPGKS